MKTGLAKESHLKNLELNKKNKYVLALVILKMIRVFSKPFYFLNLNTFLIMLCDIHKKLYCY